MVSTIYQIKLPTERIEAATDVDGADEGHEGNDEGHPSQALVPGDEKLVVGEVLGDVGRVLQLHLVRLLNGVALEVEVDPVPGEVVFVVGGREVLVPEVLAEEVDQDQVDDGEEGPKEAEEEEGLDEELEHVPVEHSQEFSESNFHLKRS